MQDEIQKAIQAEYAKAREQQLFDRLEKAYG